MDSEKNPKEYKLLSRINRPSDLRKLELQELLELAREVRSIIIETVAENGGHLAPNLGAVELSIALHYVFDAPDDIIIWDVGHQSYTHKLLTGRRDRFHTLRLAGGLSGFPKRSESVYDPFGAGHASTSISASLGFAAGRDIAQRKNKVVAVVGDGSLTGGLAYEGLNQAGHLGKDLVVVLNDNEMSISPNVGAMSSFLSRKLSTKYLVRLRKELIQFLEAIPRIGVDIRELVKKGESTLKVLLSPSMLFEALRLNYIGPIKGHRIDRLIEAFENSKNFEGPVIVHVLTTKGKGYRPAEENPAKFHGVGSFDISTGEAAKFASGPPSYTEVFGEAMVEVGARYDTVVGITAAMPDGTGLSRFAKVFPDRFFDVGIAEEHAVTFAAGLAAAGFRPVVAVYSTFLQRAYDQIIHDVCLQNLPVVFAIDRGGLVGDDGPTHHGVFDLSFLRTAPNLTIMAPKDESELRSMLHFAVTFDGPIAFRYPRGCGTGVDYRSVLIPLQPGRGEVLREGEDILMLALGQGVPHALEAADMLEGEGVSAAVVNCRFLKPLDRDLILSLCQEIPRVVTVEENALIGGFGSSVAELLMDSGVSGVRLKRVGIPDRFIEHGSQAQLRDLIGIDSRGVFRAAKELLE